MIKVVTGLYDTRLVLVLKSMKNEVVMELTSATFDRRDLAMKPITNPILKYPTIMVKDKIYFKNRENFCLLQ